MALPHTVPPMLTLQVPGVGDTCLPLALGRASEWGVRGASGRQNLTSQIPAGQPQAWAKD